MGFVKVVVLDADSSPMLMFVASDDSHVKKQPTAANAENVARGAMCTPALPRIAIAERRETWIVWVLHEVLLGHNSCLPPTSTTHMLGIFDFSFTPTSTTQTQAHNAL